MMPATKTFALAFMAAGLVFGSASAFAHGQGGATGGNAVLTADATTPGTTGKHHKKHHKHHKHHHKGATTATTGTAPTP